MVVIGSSFISMELVAAVSKRKLASIDVIGLEQTPFEAVLGKEVGAGIQKVREHSVLTRSLLNFVSHVLSVSRIPGCSVSHEEQG